MRPQQADSLRIVLSTLGDDAVAIGAARAALLGADDPARGRDHRPARSTARARMPVHRRRPHRGDRAASHWSGLRASRVDLCRAVHRSRFRRRARPRRRGPRRARWARTPSATVAARLPKYGVTAFCPTSVACDPARLRDRLLVGRRLHRPRQTRISLRPRACCPRISRATSSTPSGTARSRRSACASGAAWRRQRGRVHRAESCDDDRTAPCGVGIVTVAPEIAGGLDLVRRLAASGHRVSIGHSGATYDQALAAIDAGVTHATHLFNRMSPMSHRAPGVVGAVLESAAVSRRSDLRRLSRASGAGRAGGPRERSGRRDGDHRRHRRLGPAGRLARQARRPPHRRDRANRRTRGRHAGRQHPDHGRRRFGCSCGTSACR